MQTEKYTLRKQRSEEMLNMGLEPIVTSRDLTAKD